VWGVLPSLSRCASEGVACLRDGVPSAAEVIVLALSLTRVVRKSCRDNDECRNKGQGGVESECEGKRKGGIEHGDNDAACLRLVLASALGY
jgi:hypothetical protein